MSKDFSPEAESVVIQLRNIVNRLIRDTGCRGWMDCKSLTSVTANFSSKAPSHHLGIIPFESFLTQYDEAITKLESLLSANTSEPN